MKKKDTSSCSDSEEQEMQRIQKQANKYNNFKSTLFHNMDNLEKKLNKEILHEKDFNRHIRKTFQEYTRIEAQSYKDLIIQYMESIEECIDERALHAQEIQKRLKRFQIQECKVQEVKALDTSSGNTYNSGIVLDKGNANMLENESSRSGNECSERSNSGNDKDISYV
ncbi:hypothetical protein Tco_0830277 [Tanacetum coccineum]